MLGNNINTVVRYALFLGVIAGMRFGSTRNRRSAFRELVTCLMKNCINKEPHVWSIVQDLSCHYASYFDRQSDFR